MDKKMQLKRVTELSYSEMRSLMSGKGTASQCGCNCSHNINGNPPEFPSASVYEQRC